VGSKSGGGTRVAVKIAGEDVGSGSIPPLESRWEPVDLDTSKHAGETKDVSVTLSANISTAQRLCLDGWVLP